MTEEELQEVVDGFFLAAEYGRSDVIKALVDHARGQLSLSNVIDPVTGRSPVHVAVASGKKDALRVLLAAGFPPDHQSNQLDENDHTNRSAYILAQKLNAHALLQVFHHFLIQQVAANDVQSVTQLLQAGVDVGITDAATEGTLLHWAASCQAVDVMYFLLERKDVQRRKLVDARNLEGATPLHLACHVNHIEGIKLLLMHHADINVKGEKGVSQDKTPLELASLQEVKDLFSQSVEESEEPANALIQNDLHANESTEISESSSCVLPKKNEQVSGTCIQNEQDSKLLLQLEEKDLLVNQLKATIETLVQDAQEAQMLGEERVMLDYVRKLRDEKMILQRQLEDAMEHINVQRLQMDSLKEQIRRMFLIGKQTETDHDTLSHSIDDTASSIVGGTPDSTNSTMSSLSLHQLEKQMERVTDALQQPQAHPLKLDAWTSKAQREKDTHNRYIEKHGSDIWSTVWNGIWAGSVENEQDEDGEIIMTV
ncbi:hypothetical protein CCR75_000324 [Bremia lactucae]|uniref:Uncharacterized protein n=1 Tax=Bremia lactucae TaxID=4779 RepID=A0A976FM31_BRELC|nr:hypothetical protein CCR75_000324 [Bremia lactucae]